MATPQWRRDNCPKAILCRFELSRRVPSLAHHTTPLRAQQLRLHDFLAANATKLNGDDDALLQGDGSPALERYREERAALARMDRLERERVLVRRDEVREGLGRIATIIREAGQSLQRQYGPGAAELLFEAMDEAGREVDRCFGEQSVGDS